MEWISTHILLKLVLAHLIVDFVLQTNLIVRKKKEKKILYHMTHSLMQAIVAYAIVGLWSTWIILPVIFLTHISIDFWKITNKDKLSSFMIDQILHLTVIFLLWIYITKQFCMISESLSMISQDNKYWKILIGYLIILKPASIFLGLFTNRWRTHDTASDSLQKAGQWIGYLERILILSFILIGKIEAVGFLLAAKSIFRFGELSKSKEIKTTEYVLIGTLASFTIAILTGLILFRNL